MASYLPPTENLPIFDNQVFSQNEEALTYGEAKKYFVTFPSSQGTTTITDLIAGEIDYSAPASGSFFNIGTNQVSGGTVRLGPTGTSGVSVHAGNIDFTNNTINNATDALLNNVSLANSQTSGVLNIATSATRSGNLNINNTTGATNNINIGASGTTTTQNGLILAGTNSIVSGSSSSTITEYIGGGLSMYNYASAIAVDLNDYTLNKILNMVFTGNDVQSIAFPTAPKEGQIINIRTGKHGGSITMTTTQRLYASNTNMLTSSGIVGGTTITLQNIETYMFIYNGGRWVQMNDSLNPLVDSDLTIGSTLIANNIIIGSALGVGDISIASAQGVGGTVTIGSTNTVTTFAGGLTVDKHITLPTTTITPTSTQLGYTLSSASTGPSVAISTATGLLSVTNTPIGIYILTYDVNVDTCTSGTGATLTFTFPVTGGCTVTQVSSTLGGITNGQSTGASYTGVLKCTTATNNVTLTMACSVGTAIARSYKSTIIKIA